MLTFTFLALHFLWHSNALPEWTAELNPTVEAEMSWLERYEDRKNRSLPLVRTRLGVEPRIGSHLSLGVELATWSEEFRGRTPLETDGAHPSITLGRLYLAYAQSFSSLDWTLHAGKFESQLFASPVLWDPEVRPVGLFQSVEFRKGDGPLRLALYTGQISVDQTSQNLVQGTPQRRTWLFQQGAVIGWQQPYSWKFRLGLNSFYYRDLSETLASRAAGKGNSLNSSGSIFTFREEFLPIELIMQLQSNPYGILMKLSGAYLINLLSNEKDQGVFLELGVGNAWLRNQLRAQLSYFFVEPDLNISNLSSYAFGYTNRHGSRLDLSYFPYDTLRLGISYAYANTIRDTLDQAVRNEWTAQAEAKF